MTTPPAPWQVLLDRARRAMAVAREVQIRPDEIRPMPGQPRVHFDPDAIRRLSVSIATVGQIYPGIVRRINGADSVRYELLDGERRWRAVRRAGGLYRALVVDLDDASAAFLVAAVANFNREGHTPTEVSDSIAAMRRLGMPMDEIASALGISGMWAEQIHGLQALVPQVRALLDATLPKERRLPVTAAVQIAKVHSSLQLGLARRVVSKTLPLRGLRSEAMRVSAHAGAPLRQHRVKPADSWRTLARSARAADVALRSIGVVLESPRAAAVVANRPVEDVDRVIAHLSATADLCRAAVRRIERHR